MQHTNLNQPLKKICTTSDGASSESPVFVIESYYDSTTGDWYRKFSDGVIEQGGFAAPPASDNNYVQISFITPYTDSNITIFITEKMSSVPTSGYHGGIMAYDITQDSTTNKYINFKAWWDVNTSNAVGCYWRAVGI